MQGWVAAMAIEARWRWFAFSLCFGRADFGQQDPAVLLRGLGRVTPFIERRAMLAAILDGREQAPAASVLQRAADNLNPEYWAGAPVGAVAEKQALPEASAPSPGTWRIPWPWRAR